MIAACMIRQQPCYRREAFEAGLRANGYQLVTGGRPAGPDDLLVIWNRYGAYASMAHTWEQYGGTVLVVENGYHGKDAQGRQYYAISAEGHNGSGWWPVGTEDRFAALRVEVHPWRVGVGVVVRGQRGIGTREMASPHGWHDHVGAQLRATQAGPVSVVPHPGAHDPNHPQIEALLEHAGACVIWCSSVGVKALVMGVPVWYAAPHFICEGAARKFAHDPKLASPLKDDAKRAQALHGMAHAQWSVAEIETGEPFARFRVAIAQRRAA